MTTPKLPGFTVGTLRHALSTLPEDMAIVVRSWDSTEDGISFLCGGISEATQEADHDGGAPFLALNVSEDAEDFGPEREDEPDYNGRHVDDFVNDYKAPPYARWVLWHFRLPAFQACAFAEFMADRKLFCTWQGQRWRCIGASRMGDVWLTSDFTRDNGYEHRVAVDVCSEWSAEP